MQSFLVPCVSYFGTEHILVFGCISSIVIMPPARRPTAGNGLQTDVLTGWYRRGACAVLRRSAAAPDAAEHDEEAHEGRVLHRLGSPHPARPPLHLWQPEQCCRQLGIPCHLKPQSEPRRHQPGAIYEAQISAVLRLKHACSTAT